MKTAIVRLESAAPYSQSKHYSVDQIPKLPREIPRDYEARTWRERMHADEKGQVFIPAGAFKNALSEAAKYMSIPVPGAGKATYTKNIEAGVLVLANCPLGIKRDDVPGEWLFLPSDGKRGGSKRVDKCFGVIHTWTATVEFVILDEIITEEVFRKVLEAAGRMIGIGRFRPRNNGTYGRFNVVDLVWG